MISTLDYDTVSGVSDEYLMQAITDRNESALSELYSRYGGRLRSMIGTVVHEEGEADDVLQDIVEIPSLRAGQIGPDLGAFTT